MLTGRKPRLNLPQVPSSIGHKHGHFQDSQGITQKTTYYIYFHRSHRIGNLDNQCLSRKCMETFGEQLPLINQLLNQILTGSGFQTNSILRRTRSMIKPRSSPSHFELQAEAQQRNFEGETSSRSHTSFNQLNGQSMLPVMPTTSVTTPATIDRDSQVGAPDPITGATSPTSDRGATPQSSDDNTKTFHSIHQRCSSSSLHPHPESDR